ncbi:Hypothetical protein SRAE_2000196200 [Strongyloides ratti]|uniref:Uncharacterized protein n=1 Tax=Strongyloides ratti TaxID=34506 RepID=A0A090LGQ6_STRRB|nr:Hypothetical protein SRAE_2000196200 [Strongyloides ratti]CEF67298.2 Hypothetical protein SRAE_2000196200 [Strongyloides ratti]
MFRNLYNNFSWVLILYIILNSYVIWSKSIKIVEKDIGKRVTKRQVECLQRCQRIFERMLQKEGTNIEGLNDLLLISDTFENVTNNRNICWESMDLTDCLKHCSGIGGSASVNWLDFVINPSTGISTLAIPKYIVKQLPWFKPLIKRCLPYVEPQKSNFLCISKFRSFMGIKCSAYKKEAEIQYKNIKTQKEYVETCRFLHYHHNCLSKTVLDYCPNAKRLFNSQTIRKYFLSHILPENDLRFDDDFLDQCKLKQKSFEKVKFDNEEKNEGVLEITTLNPNINKISTKRSTGIFLSTESLEDIPPNFIGDSYGRYSVVPQITTPTFNKYTTKPSSTEEFVGSFTDDQMVKPILYEIDSGSIVNNIKEEQNKSSEVLIKNKMDDDIFPQDRPILDGKVYIKKIRHFGESKKDPDFDMQDTEVKNITFEDIKKHNIISDENRFTSYDYIPHNNIYKKNENVEFEEPIISDPESFALLVLNYDDKKTVGKIRYYREEIKNQLIEIEKYKNELEELKETLEQIKYREKRLDHQLEVVTKKSINMDKKIRFFKKQIFNLMSINIMSTKDTGYLLHELIDLSKELLEILKVTIHTDQVCVQIAVDEKKEYEKELKQLLNKRREYQKELKELKNEINTKITREEVLMYNKEEMIQLDMEIWKVCDERDNL